MILRLFANLRGHKLHATDGDIGSVSDVYFDDATWTVRYLVVDAGSWLIGRRVLLVPEVFGKPAGEKESIPVSLSKEQIRHSPDMATHKPVSRRHEEELHRYYGWPPYWEGEFVTRMEYLGGINPGAAGPEVPIETKSAIDKEVVASQDDADRHLRSASELHGYHIHANDGEIGSVTDLVIDEEEWRVRYLVVETGSWFSGSRVLIPPAWIREISWQESSVQVDVDRKTIANSPPFDPHRTLTREDEESLYRHYSRPDYWS